MDVHLSEADRAFREEVRAFVRSALSPATRRKIDEGIRLDRDDVVGWMRALSKRGWIAPNWPQEAGGPGWTQTQKTIFEEECFLGAAPTIVPFGTLMVGPVLLAFGSDDQKRRHLPAILSSETIWCQGYSEPNAGSDLASLQCRAVRDGDHYVVNGRKIWTSQAHWADWMFTLVRTSRAGRKQEGISVLLIDMKLPGVTLRPIRRFSGFYEFNEVILEDVRVPATELVHEENEGWAVAKYLLGHERVGTTGFGLCLYRLRRLKEIAGEQPADGMPLIEEPAFRRKVAEFDIRLDALRMTLMRMVSRGSADRAVGPEASLLKIRGTELQQDVFELLMEAVGWYGLPYVEEALRDGWNGESVGPIYAAGLAPRYFDWRKTTIYGGSNEIQKNIISKAVLGL